MKKNTKFSAGAGIVLFTLAAFFTISLLSVVFDFGPQSAVHNTRIFKIGKMFTGVYGFSSALIPLFLIVAAFQCFSSNWKIKNGILLLGSVVPFFTVDALEHLCRILYATESGDTRLVKIGGAVLMGLLLVALEYLLLSLAGDFADKKAENQPREQETDSDDQYIEENDIDLEETEKIDDSEESPEEPEENQIPVADEVEETEKPVESESKAETESFADELPLDSGIEASEEDSDEIVKAEGPSPFDHVFDAQEQTIEDAIKSAEAGNPVEYSAGMAAGTFENAESQQEIPQNDVPNEETLEIPAENAGEEVLQEEISPEIFEEEPSIESEPELTEDDLIEAETLSESPEENFEEPEIQAEESEMAESPEISDVSEEAEVADGENDHYITPLEGKDLNGFDKGFFDIDINAEDEDELEEQEERQAQGEKVRTLADVFAEMGEEAAKNPVLPEESEEIPLETAQIEENFEEPHTLEDASEESAENSFEDYNFDPTAEPVVDSEGNLIQKEEDFTEPKISEEISDSEELSEETAADEIPSDSADEDNADEAEIESEIEDDSDQSLNSRAEGLGLVSPIDEFEEIDVDDINSEKNEEPESDPEEFDEPPVPQEEITLSNAEEDSGQTEVAEIEEKVNKVPARKGPYVIPTDGILTSYPDGKYWIIDDETKQAAQDLKDTLNEFKIEAEVTGIRKGPVVTMFEILPAPGVKLSKIVALQDNIALRLAASSVRIVAPIPGKHAVGIEVPNKQRSIVSFKEIIDRDLPQFKKMAIPVVLGKDISGEPQVIDLAKTPHLLIAGSTGAGKSVCVNSMILSILYKRSPRDVKLILIDPKIVELKLYNDIPHLLTPVITESKRAFQSLQYCLCEMERRYALLDGMQVRDITSYNKRIVERHIATEKLPYIVVIIDEFADLMATTGKELESTVARLAAMSRAVGIHLVLATQRPSIDVITGLIKANIPSRIAFMVASKMDSRIIIDQVGAEKLLGKGDMLYASATDPFPIRIQGTLVADDEVERTVEYVKGFGEPDYIDDEIFVDDEDDGASSQGLFSDGEDPLYDEALQIVIQSGKASASYIQRRLKIGYNRAARLVEEMEERGIVGPANGSKPREVIHVPTP